MLSDQSRMCRGIRFRKLFFKVTKSHVTIFVFILVLINTLAFSHQNEFVKLTKKDILFLGISALTTTLSWIFYYKAIKIGPVSEVALIDKASIVLTLILSFIFLKEQVTLKIAIGSMLIVGGILVLTIK